MKKNIQIILYSLALLSCGCSRKATDYRSYLDGKEIIYPGAIAGATALPGNQRLELQWHPSADPSVAKYVVYWNNYADSLIVPATSHDPQDTIKCIVSNLQEYSYTFFVNSYDSVGNKSVTTEIDNARAYGSIYQTNLFNRPVNVDTPFVVQDNQTDVLLNFLPPDTINTNTVVTYTNAASQQVKLNLPAVNSSILLSNYKFGTPVSYQSSYIPKQGAIDTFTTALADTFPTIFKMVQCDRSKYIALHLPTDITAAYGTTFESMWDGNRSPRGYPDCFNSDGNSGYPRQFTMDLGELYNLGQMEMVGRTCCHNPTDYQIWAIADTANALTTLASNDPGWESQAVSKGWTKLTEVIRTDVASDNVLAESPWLTKFSATESKYRYLVVRILKVADGSNEINISQITFWNKM